MLLGFHGDLSQARILTVAPGASIQAAIDGAAAGDVIEIARGRYRENLRVDKALTLRGIARPIIDGGLKGNTVDVTAENVVIDGLNVRDSGDSLREQNAGIYLKPGGYRGTHVYRSIIWQPGHALIAMGGTPNLNCFQYLLANDLGVLPASTLNGVGDPLFNNAAAGNFRLRLASPAIDYAVAQAANSTRDIGPRVLDDPTIVNEFGAHDLGAYEIDQIFADGFE